MIGPDKIMRKLLTFLIAAIFSISVSASSFGGSMMLLGVGSSSVAGTGWCGLIPQSGLVNCWPYDTANLTSGTATDVIGGNNSTQTNVAVNGSGPSSHLNNAGSFVAGSSSHGLTTLSTFPAAPNSAFSIVIWLKPGLVNSSQRPIANSHTDTDDKGFQLKFNGASNNLQFQMGNSSGNANTILTTNAVTQSAWQMFTFTYDGTTSLAGYQGTTAIGPASSTGGDSPGTANLGFGYNPAYSGDYYTGLIAGVAIYNRVLTSGEVTTINGL
jgi:hypothetical protein